MTTPTAPTPPRAADYQAIEAAVMETEKGRWFLAEFARRNRQADTEVVLEAIARLEGMLADSRAETDRLRAAVGEVARLVRRTLDDRKGDAIAPLLGTIERRLGAALGRPAGISKEPAAPAAVSPEAASVEGTSKGPALVVGPGHERSATPAAPVTDKADASPVVQTEQPAPADADVDAAVASPEARVTETAEVTVPVAEAVDEAGTEPIAAREAEPVVASEVDPVPAKEPEPVVVEAADRPITLPPSHRIPEPVAAEEEKPTPVGVDPLARLSRAERYALFS